MKNPGIQTIRNKFMVMMSNPVYFANIEDEYVRALPVLTFPGTISLIDHPAGLEAVKRILRDEFVIGFDTETRPSFKKGHYHNVALLQLSTADHAVLIRMNKVKLPKFIIDILENDNIVKVGVAIKDDINSLNKISPFIPGGFIDLQQFVKQFGIEDNGLKKLVANIMGFRISKKSQTSNWEQAVLTKEQLEYAATDAWVCRQMYEILTSHKQAAAS
ncbi:MAG TPA: 3'-5' exonuclease [Bacteroidales bacterium]|nr:3'-5' exonuclease [Bacteroidales bacterium]